MTYGPDCGSPQTTRAIHQLLYSFRQQLREKTQKAKADCMPLLTQMILDAEAVGQSSVMRSRLVEYMADIMETKTLSFEPG